MEPALVNDTDAGADAGESVAFCHRPVDLAHLSRRSMGDITAEREMLDVFRRQAKAHFEKLRHARDDNAWRNAAKLLCISARGVGAWRIVNRAERIAGAAPDVRAELLTTLKQHIDEANAFIETVFEYV